MLPEMEVEIKYMFLITVSPLHTNEVCSESAFVSLVYS